MDDRDDVKDEEAGGDVESEAGRPGPEDSQGGPGDDAADAEAALEDAAVEPGPVVPEEKVFYWRTAVKLVTKTPSFLGLTAGVYAAFFLLSLLWFAIWGGLAFLMARLEMPFLALVAIVIGLGVGGGIVAFARRYLLYLVTGGHIAVMTELLKNGSLPEGKSQIAFGRERVKELFVDMSILFGLDQLIKGTLNAIQNRIIRASSLLPLPGGFRKVAKLITEILKRSLIYVDEAILSYAIYRGEKGVWTSARHGVILYAQSYKPILKTAALSWALGKLFLFLAFIVFMAVGIGLLLALGINHIIAQAIVVGVALSAAYALEQVVFEPFALAYVLVTYYYSIAGTVPDPEWDQRIQSVSDSFKKLVGKAREESGEEAEVEKAEPAPLPNPGF